MRRADAEPQSVEDGIHDLEDMMSELQITFGDLGYKFSLKMATNADDDSGLPRKIQTSYRLPIVTQNIN